jgi:hypothetical protein
MTLIAAALLDQERRVLAARGVDLPHGTSGSPTQRFRKCRNCGRKFPRVGRRNVYGFCSRRPCVVVKQRTLADRTC